MSTDPYNNRDDISAPAVRATPINLASDTTFTEPNPRGIYVGVTGDVVVALDGEPALFRTFRNAQAGSILPIRPAIVRSTSNGTTATDLLALY